MGEAVPDPGEYISEEDLVAHGREIDASLTTRRLRRYRSGGLLPKKMLIGYDGRRPRYALPPEAVGQLRRLLELCADTRNPTLLRIQLWCEGYGIDIDRARASITTHLRSQYQFALDQLDGVGASTDEERRRAIDQFSDKLAKKRKGVPRFGRQSYDDRRQGIALGVRMLLGEPVTSEEMTKASASLERVVGVEPGRSFRLNGEGPWLTGPPEESFQAFREIGSIPALIEAVERATDEELTKARDITRTLIHSLGFASRSADALSGKKNAAGWGVAGMFANEMGTSPYLVAFVVAIFSKADLRKNLADIVEACGGTKELERLIVQIAALPEGVRKDRIRRTLEGRDFVEQASLKRLLAEFGIDYPM